jgi:hypothetical protein
VPQKSKLYIQLSKSLHSHRQGERREGQLRLLRAISFSNYRSRLARCCFGAQLAESSKLVQIAKNLYFGTGQSLDELRSPIPRPKSRAGRRMTQPNFIAAVLTREASTPVAFCITTI